MKNGLQSRCPAEVYDDREGACRVMLAIFETQSDCARFHGCPARRCAIEGRWPEPGQPDDGSVHGLLAGFVGVAFCGPGGTAVQDPETAEV